jgi:hypothetical protein
MRGFDPRIHLEKTSRRKKMDCRVEPGNDGGESNRRKFAGKCRDHGDSTGSGNNTA